MSDLHSKASTAPRDQRRHSSTDFVENVSTSNNPHHKILIRSSTGTSRRFRQTSVPESEEVAGWVRNIPITSPAMTLTIHIDLHLNAPSSLHSSNLSILNERRMKRSNAPLDRRRHHYPRISRPRTRPMSTQFS